MREGCLFLSPIFADRENASHTSVLSGLWYRFGLYILSACGQSKDRKQPDWQVERSLSSTRIHPIRRNMVSNGTYWLHRVAIAVVVGAGSFVTMSLLNWAALWGILAAALVLPLVLHALWTHPDFGYAEYWVRLVVDAIVATGVYHLLAPLGLSLIPAFGVGIVYFVTHVGLDVRETLSHQHAEDLVAHAA